MAETTIPSGPVSEALSRTVAAIARGGLLRRSGAALVAVALLAAGYLVVAQVAGERGIAPTASSADIEVRGIEVDITAESGEAAREEAWKRAQRLAWEKVDGPAISDSELSGMVSAVVIQKERIGPKRYIATLGVIFDRQRASRYLGGADNARSSAPMLLLPVTATAGTFLTYETRNPWQRAWAEFNPGRSRIDYVRPSGAGGDSLFLNFGQAGRRSRAWWRTTLDQFGAADVLVPVARLEYQFPGGPVTGTFTARYGPDNRFLDSFSLRASGPAALPAMLEQAVERMDRIYESALAEGKLQPDPTLRVGGSGDVDPALQRLIEIGRAMRAREAAAIRAEESGAAVAGSESETESTAPQAEAVRSIVIQFASPDAGAFDGALSGVRGTPGVRGVAVTSTAIGGTSVMSVSYGGSLQELAAALRARGFAVREGSGALAISR